MSIHSRIDWIQINVLLFVFFEKDDHLVGSNDIWLEDYVVLINANFASRNVWSVVVSSIGNLSMEKELQRGLTPGKVRVLSSVQISPNPVFRVLWHVLLKKLNRISQRSCYVVAAVVFPFVLRISCLAKKLEVRFFALFSNLYYKSLIGLLECIRIAHVHSIVLIIRCILME